VSWMVGSAAKTRRSVRARAAVTLLALCTATGCIALWGQSADAGAVEGLAACSAGDQAMAAGQWETAADLYTECIRAGPARFEILSNLATAQSHLGRMQDATDSYEKALLLAPDNPKVEFNLAVTFVKEGKYNAAVEHLSKLQRSAPDLRYEELLAFCYYHLGHYSLAARAAEKVQAVQPDDPANALILGSAYTRLGQYDQALPLITLALKAAGSAEGHMIMGETLLGLRLYHPAMDELTQAAQSQPDLPGLHSALGVGKVGLGDSVGAVAEFNQALVQNPNDYQANYYLGRLKRIDGDLDLARKYLDTANQLQPGSPEVLFEIAALSVSKHHYTDAEPLLLKVIAQEPGHREAHFLLATCYQKSGRLEAAKREREIFEKLKSEQRDQGVPSAGDSDPSSTASSVQEP
jgi:tetratricopeptide (TPR) repeat protein